MNYQCMIMARIDSVGTVLDVVIWLMLGINATAGHSIKKIIDTLQRYSGNMWS